MNCVVLSVVFTYVDWILLSSPDKEAWYKIRYYGDDKKAGTVRDKADSKAVENDGAMKKGRKKEDVVGVPAAGFLSRLWWGVRLATTNRYVGWSCQVKNVPVEVDPGYPRLYVCGTIS